MALGADVPLVPQHTPENKVLHRATVINSLLSEHKTNRWTIFTPMTTCRRCCPAFRLIGEKIATRSASDLFTTFCGATGGLHTRYVSIKRDWYARAPSARPLCRGAACMPRCSVPSHVGIARILTFNFSLNTIKIAYYAERTAYYRFWVSRGWCARARRIGPNARRGCARRRCPRRHPQCAQFYPGYQMKTSP